MAAARRSRAEWREVVQRWERSGLDRGTFAARAGVNPSTLGWWRWKLEVEGVDFFNVVVAGEEVQPEITVADDTRAPSYFMLDAFGIGAQVPMGFDAGELRRLLDVLC